MPIVYSAVVPHSPVFLPSFEKAARDSVAATIQSFAQVHKQIASLQPDVLLVIAPHDETRSRSDNYIFHVPSIYHAEFQEFGDLVTKTEYTPDLVLANQLKEKLTQEGIGVTYTGEEKLDYSAGVPLECIAKGSNAKVLVVHPQNKPLLTLYEEGKQFVKILQESPKRIICIASSDLSHCLTQDAPLPYNLAGVQIDETIVKSIRSKRTKSILSIQPDLIDEVGACGIPSLAVLLGIMKALKHGTNVLSYEGSLGVGHLVVEYTI